MTFTVDAVRSEQFDDFDMLLSFVSEEEKRLFRLPLKGYIEKGARFNDEHGIGTDGDGYKFNEASYRLLCNMAGISPSTLENLQEKGLASRLLNDLFLSGNISRNLDSLEIVCDEENRQVLGFVSESYVGYSNKRFVDEVIVALDPERNRGSLFPDLGEFEFQQGYSVNSRLYLRIVSKKTVGKVQGRGGAGEDISKIGLELTNTMAGGYALRMSYFIHRLICANGLIAPVSGGAGKIIHSGSLQNFERRLHQGVGSILGSLQHAAKLLESLAEIPFDTRLLASSARFDDMFSIVPGLDLKSECKRIILNRDYSAINDKKERALQRKADMLASISTVLGRKHSLAVFNSHWRNNASMWDFINIFTEYAKELDIQKKLEAERRAGEVADWIAKNKRQFANPSVSAVTNI